MKSDILYTIHIRECIDRIQDYTSGVDHEQFMASSMLQDAVLRNLQAHNQLSEPQQAAVFLVFLSLITLCFLISSSAFPVFLISLSSGYMAKTSADIVITL